MADLCEAEERRDPAEHDEQDRVANSGPVATRWYSEETQLAVAAAHDMSGPLAYILANLEYLERQVSALQDDLPPGRTEELKQCVREIAIGTNRVRDIASELRGAVLAGKTESEVDVRGVLLSCIKVTRTEIDHGARVLTEFDAVPPVVGTESQLSRVFLNLLMNAAQAVASAPTRNHFIRVVTRNEADRSVVVEITDSGPGIPTEHLGRVFEPFFTTKPANEGTGLGLATCRRILDRLGGEVSVQSPQITAPPFE